ncbi:cobalt ABC transporter permease [Listeria aquatica FSL S10-1188]|uniref:Cobalt ABC transporter permease n=1 Tax=Listeria aquatica FSL S10-1188 TaxID=1265818 RepID=W7AXW3_9LIST|nr:cobalt ABC transporter permease [Listeria aquatica FSL S10-1188]
MMDKMILGRYIPGNSWLHSIDPRAKITAVMYFIVIVFMANNWLTYLFLFAYVLYLVFSSKVPFMFFVKGLQPIMILILLTLLLQVFFHTRWRYFARAWPDQSYDTRTIERY